MELCILEWNARVYRVQKTGRLIRTNGREIRKLGNEEKGNEMIRKYKK